MTNIVFDALGYTCTNENIGAVVLALDLKPEDIVLSIANDIAFAILEYVESVKAVDSNPEQVDFFKRRSIMLGQEDLHEFLVNPKLKADPGFFMGPSMRRREEIDTNRRDCYFQYGNRLSRIRERLQYLEVEEADIFEVAMSETGFTKVYLSNTISFNHSRLAKPTRILSEIAANLSAGGLIYIADHGQISRIHGNNFLPDGLVIDENLTKVAQNLKRNRWSPAVYKKT